MTLDTFLALQRARVLQERPSTTVRAHPRLSKIERAALRQPSLPVSYHQTGGFGDPVKDWYRRLKILYE